MVCLGFGALAAGAAAWSGWTNAEVYPMGSSVELTVTLHRWIAIASAALAVLAFACGLGARVSARAMLPYRLCLLGAALSVGAAGHFGGSLVYGEGYLLEPFERPAADARGPAEPELTEGDATGGEAAGAQAARTRTVDYARDIQPILERACMECHGPRRQKGKLRLDYREAAMRRGVIVPGDSEASDLFLRVALPADDEDVMPPADEPERLSEGEIALLAAWIDEGASWGEGGSTDPVQAELEEPAARVVDAPDASDPAIADAIAAIESLGGSVVPIAEDTPGLEVHFELLGASFGDDDLAVLDGCAGAVVWLNLAGTGVTDAGVTRLGSLPNLRSLHLERTAVTDAGVAGLASLPSLSYLNLHSTGVTAGCLESVASMPALERVFLWNTARRPLSSTPPTASRL